MLHGLLDVAPRRTLTHAQEEAVLEAFGAQGLPLYLRLAASEIRRWRSFDPPQLGEEALPETTADLLATLLAWLEAPERHGRALVAQTLSDIAVARFGLAEGELLDILARDSAVREGQHQLAPASPAIDMELPLPVALWARLYTELGSLLSEREFDGVRLYGIYHQQLRAAIEARYLAGTGETREEREGSAKSERHLALARYFAVQPWQFGPTQWNWRKVRELVLQQEGGGDRQGAEQTLTELAEMLEKAVREQPDSATRATIAAIIDAQKVTLLVGRYWGIAERLLALQLAAWRALGDQASEGNTLFNLGRIAYSPETNAAAQHYLEQALAIARELGDRVVEQMMLNRAGLNAFADNELDDARRYLEQALEIAREVGDRFGEGVILHNMGDVAAVTRDPEAAGQHFEQALAIHREVHDRIDEGSTLRSLGLLAMDTDDLGAAQTYFDQALTIAQEVGDRPGEVSVLVNLSQLYHRHEVLAEMRGWFHYRPGEPSAAQDYMEQALALAQAIGAWTTEWRIYVDLAQRAEHWGDIQGAWQYYEQAITIVHDKGDTITESRILQTLAEKSSRWGDKEEARGYYERQLILAQEGGDRFSEGALLVHIAALTVDLGEKDKALPYYEKALATFEAIGGTEPAAFVRERLDALWPSRKRGWWPFGRDH